MDEPEAMNANDVHCLVTLARVFGLPAMKLEGGMMVQHARVAKIIEKWDRLNGGKRNPPNIEAPAQGERRRCHTIETGTS